MSENWEVFKPGELSIITFECPNCNTGVTFHAVAQVPGKELNCTGCNKDLPGVAQILSQYANFYKEATKAEHRELKISLRALRLPKGGEEH